MRSRRRRRHRRFPGARLRGAFHGAGLLSRSRTLRDLTRLTERLPTRGNRIEFFHAGGPLFDRMLEDIAGAEVRVSVEMYMFLNDPVGRRFARALSERARSGVKVRLIYDAVGCLGTARHLFRQMQSDGVEILEYHPVAPWRERFALFRRNHRKTLVVDGQVGYTGGVNIGLPWARRRDGGQGWRDTHARISGPAAGDLEVLFRETWFMESNELLELTPTLNREPPPAIEEIATQVFVVAGRGTRKRHIRRYYLTAIARARHRIDLASSYFIPDRGLRRALYRARERGVRVRLLLPDQSDVPVALLACRAFFRAWLKHGIEIHLWTPSILHAKYAVIDGAWSTVGSSNIDHFSLNRNLEANLAIIGRPTGAELEAQFDQDLARSRRLTWEEWKKRPWMDRVWERLAYWVRAWL